MKPPILIALFFILRMAQAFAQASLMPAPINSPAEEWNPVMLPDSSIILSSNRSGGNPPTLNWKCFRFEHKNGVWRSAPSQLDSLINSLIVSVGMPSFRFSSDFSRVVVTLYDGDRRAFFESQLSGGRWTLFREILRGMSVDIWHGLSLSDDHTTLYATSMKGTLYSLKKIDGDWQTPKTITAFEHLFRGIQQPIAIGNNGLLFQGYYKSEIKKGTDNSFFFTRLLPNGQWSAPSKVDGLFGHDVSLTPSLTHFLFHDWTKDGDMAIGQAEVPKFLQREIQKSERKVPTQTKRENTAATDAVMTERGRYFALLIGNSNYKLDNLDLNNPAADVDVLFRALITNYQFETGNIIQLVDADRNTILSELYGLRSRLNATDNLLIFYAGHGYYDEQIKQGYWWPIDATPANPATWISNSDLREQIRGINSKHTLLISDACFSGGIFKTRGAEELKRASFDIQQLYRMPSRRAMTSGTLSTVPDESVFFKYLIKYLLENNEPFISSGQLFATFRNSVLNNSLTVPQDGVIMDTGDEGGDFIFIRK